MQVVLFHVPPKTEKQVAQLLWPYDISVRTVSREQYTTPLGVLLGLRKAGRMLPSLGFEFAEPMLLMHGLPDDMVDAVLAQLKAAKISIDLKAITTPTNLEWNAMQMYAELRREREKFFANRK